MAVQVDGKVLLGGSFTTLQPNGAAATTARQYIARLNADGTVDTNFDPAANSTVYGVALQADGRVVLGGSFSLVGGATRSSIARLNSSPAPVTLTAPAFDWVRWLRGGAAPEVQEVAFAQSTNGGSTWTPLGQGTRISGGWQLTGLSLPAGGLVRARGRTIVLIRNCTNNTTHTA